MISAEFFGCIYRFVTTAPPVCELSYDILIIY